MVSLSRDCIIRRPGKLLELLKFMFGRCLETTSRVPFLRPDQLLRGKSVQYGKCRVCILSTDIKVLLSKVPELISR